MPKFAANLSFMYNEVPFMDRFAAAAKAGFKAVEFMSPYEQSPEDIKKALDANKLTQQLFNTPSGNWDAGERGIAVLADREKDFTEGVAKAVKYAKVLGTPRVNVLCGKSSEAKEKVLPLLVERLRFAADEFAKININLIIEHINNYDMPGFFVNTPSLALEIINKVDRKNALVQYDVYHAQRMSGEITAFLRTNLAKIGHIQIADNPGRGQPGTGEVNYKFFLDELDKVGYQGWVGLEYKPVPNTNASLDWIKAMGYKL